MRFSLRRLWHLPREGGRLFRGVIDRLIGAGFYECKTDAKAFGVVARR